MPNTAAWVDTGFLVALFARDDEHFASAVEFLANAQRLELHSLWLVVAEACFFLDTPGKLSITHKSPSPLVGEGISWFLILTESVGWRCV